MPEWYSDRYPKVKEERPKEEKPKKGEPKGKKPRGEKLRWDESVQKRLGAIDKSTKELGKRVDDFVAILEQKVESGKKESLNGVTQVRDQTLAMVGEMKAGDVERHSRLEEGLNTEFGKRIGEVDNRIRSIEGSLEEIERKLFEGANEMAMVRNSVDSKNIGTRIKFLDDQIGRTVKTLKRLEALVADVNSAGQLGVDKRLSEIEVKVDSSSPADISHLRLRVEGLEKALESKEVLRKIKVLRDQLERIEARTQLSASSRSSGS